MNMDNTMLLAVLLLIAAAVQAYLLGSIDTGIIVSRVVYHDDVRRHGSGAAGMTNMLRTFGKKAAAMTAAGDIAKGALAVCIGRWLYAGLLQPRLTAEAAGAVLASPYAYVYAAAIFAIIGHSKPLYFGFKGGKGVLVSAGAIVAVEPILIPILFVVFLLCLVPTGMVSLGSVTMAAAYPLISLLYGLINHMSMTDIIVRLVGSCIVGGMVIYMHRSNLRRIREGKEYRFGRKNKK